jgi:hypothetical protein
LGVQINEYEGDPIVEIDHETKTITVAITPPSYRPLGAFKALVKVALTLMDESDLARVPEALPWLRAPDLTTDQVADGTLYSCIRTFTPGPAPFATTKVVLLRRKRPDVLGFLFVLVVVFGNVSFQIVVPAPQQDRHHVGKQVILHPVPVFAFMDADRVSGPTRTWLQDLSSPSATKADPSMSFHFDSIEMKSVSGKGYPPPQIRQ